MKLRPYQEEAKEKILKSFDQGIKRQLIMLPTGCGKTPLFLSVLAERDGIKLVIAPNEQICLQVKRSALTWIPDCRPCYLKDDEAALSQANLIIATDAMAARPKRLEKLQSLGISSLVIDEAHHAPAITKGKLVITGRARSIINGIKPEFLLGVTATPVRLDGIGMGEVFQELTYQKNIPEMIETGYLCPLKCFEIYTKVDINKGYLAHQQNEADKHRNVIDDDEQKEIAEKGNKINVKAINTQLRNELIVNAYKEKAIDRNHTIAFCLSVAHAQSLCRVFNDHGVKSECITCDTPPAIREAILARFRTRETRVLTNYNILAEGFDFPALDCILMTRPTRSHALYTQCVGRGTRIFPGKDNCLILDFRDNCTAELVSFASMDTREKEDKYRDKPECDPRPDEEKEVSPILHKSDGSLVFEEKNVGMNEHALPTNKQMEFIKKYIDVNFNFDTLTRGQARDIIANKTDEWNKISDKQLFYLKKCYDEGRSRLTENELKSLTKDEAKEIIGELKKDEQLQTC